MKLKTAIFFIVIYYIWCLLNALLGIFYGLIGILIHVVKPYDRGIIFLPIFIMIDFAILYALFRKKYWIKKALYIELVNRILMTIYPYVFSFKQSLPNIQADVFNIFVNIILIIFISKTAKDYFKKSSQDASI